jgi:hypothetical protein
MEHLQDMKLVRQCYNMQSFKKAMFHHVAERRPALSRPSLKRAMLIDEPLVRRRLHCRSSNERHARVTMAPDPERAS